MHPLPPKTVSRPEDPAAMHRINASWLVRLRWAGIAGQALVIAYVQWGLSIALPLFALAAILACELLANVAMEIWLYRRGRVSASWVAGTVAFDVTCFSLLLYFTGGPFNPFSFLYLVYIALAALVLEPRWAWGLVLFSVGSSAALFAGHVPLPIDHSGHAHHHGAMHGGEPLDLHLRGMWVALAVAAAFIVYFLDRVKRALTERETELARARDVAVRSEKLASMATLAAGAAHELATPLSTIAVVAKELERAETSPSTAADAKLIRQQVERCRDILAQMAGGAGVSPGEMAQSVSPAEVVRTALSGLQHPERVTVSLGADPAEGALHVPLRATAQALRNLVKNGLDASTDSEGVSVNVERDDQAVRFVVTDTGPGMSADVLSRAAEPFFTTKEPGQGMGLGLFLTRSVVEQLGGYLQIQSAAGKGTIVTMSVPLRAATIGRIDASPDS